MSMETKITQNTTNDGGRVELNSQNSPSKGSWLWGLLLFAVLILIDQATKIAAEIYFCAEGAPSQITIIPDWVYLRITFNRGISYGMGSDASPEIKLAVVALTGVMMTVLAVMYFKTDARRTLLRIALVFIVAGGIGNFIDRIYYRVWDPTTASSISTVADGVRDMVDISSLGFAVCNFADFFICGGAVMLVLALLFFDSSAIFPIGEKYKQLAQEELLREEAKQAEKQAKKQAKQREKK